MIEYKLQYVDILLPDDTHTELEQFAFPALVGIDTGLAIVGGLTENYDSGYSLTHISSGYCIPIPERIAKLSVAQALLEKVTPLANWKMTTDECIKNIKDQYGSGKTLEQKIAKLYEEVHREN